MTVIEHLPLAQIGRALISMLSPVRIPQTRIARAAGNAQRDLTTRF